MQESIPTVEQVAQKIFRAQARGMVPYPFLYEDLVRFAQRVGAERANEHFRAIMELLSWGHDLDEITGVVKAL